MPVNTRSLASHDIVVEVPIYAISRKKSNRNIPPRKSDIRAWRHNGSPEPELVLRSPLDPNTWLSPAELNMLCKSLSREEAPFTSRKSSLPILRPEPGQFAWFRPRNPRKKSRDRYIYDGEKWVEAPERADDGY
ncbi:MAG: hypothetical protein KGI49_03755 [Patescibacteria group bacterium]|nr:hypothetical protein [Patescibacteria group bacterium]